MSKTDKQTIIIAILIVLKISAARCGREVKTNLVIMGNEKTNNKIVVVLEDRSYENDLYLIYFKVCNNLIFSKFGINFKQFNL